MSFGCSIILKWVQNISIRGSSSAQTPFFVQVLVRIIFVDGIRCNGMQSRNILHNKILVITLYRDELKGAVVEVASEVYMCI